MAMTDAELAALWRRHFDVLDQLVYGFLEGENRKDLDEEGRAESAADEQAIVSLHDLGYKRHALSTVLHYGGESREEFKASDPESPNYVGVEAAQLLRARRETWGEL
jgi:hypothetical protein